MTRRSLASVLLLAVMALGGCSITKSPAPVTSTAPVQRQLADPTLSFASTARVGEQTSLLDTAGTLATVRVEREYHAASGETCRRYLVSSAADQRASHVACRGRDGVWRSVTFMER